MKATERSFFNDFETDQVKNWLKSIDWDDTDTLAKIKNVIKL